jgi:hypothetical protein
MERRSILDKNTPGKARGSALLQGEDCYAEVSDDVFSSRDSLSTGR